MGHRVVLCVGTKRRLWVLESPLDAPGPHLKGWTIFHATMARAARRGSSHGLERRVPRGRVRRPLRGEEARWGREAPGPPKMPAKALGFTKNYNREGVSSDARRPCGVHVGMGSGHLLASVDGRSRWSYESDGARHAGPARKARQILGSEFLGLCAGTLVEALENPFRVAPAPRFHLRDEDGHILCFHNDEDTSDLASLDGPLRDGDPISFVPAVSGGTAVSRHPPANLRFAAIEPTRPGPSSRSDWRTAPAWPRRRG